MSHEGTAELRIFTGLHAGARAILPPGKYLLGSDPSCDFVICDKGIAHQHAELSIDAKIWRYRLLLADEGTPPEGLELAPGIGVPMGPVVISIDAANAPWREISEPATSTKIVDALAENDEGEAGDPPFVTEPPDFSAARVSPTKGKTRCWSWTFAISTGIIALALFLIPRPQAEAPTPAVIAASLDDGAQTRRITAVLMSLNMVDRVQLIRQPGNHFLVSATLISDDEYEQLASALSRLNPRPGLQVSDERELVQSVLEAVSARGDGLKAEYLGAGRFRLLGNVASDEALSALFQALKAEFPAVREFEDALTTPAVLAMRVLDRLREEGLPEVQGQWHEGVFIIDTMTAPPNRLALARALEQIDKEWGRWLKFAVRTGLPVSSAAPRADSLPFQLSSIVGGTTPYVILPDGQKVLPGGHIGRWRLVEISSTQVVFDGPRKVTLSR